MNKNFKELENKINNKDYPVDSIRCNDEEWAYSIGWLWRILMDLQPYSKDTLIRHLNKKKSILKEDTIILYKKVNARLCETNWKVKKLLIIVIGGFVDRADEPDVLTNTEKECIIFGYNTLQ